MTKYCDGDISTLDKYLSGGNKLILDAGCGAGYSAMLFFGGYLNNNDYLGVDISESVYIARKSFIENGYKGDFIKYDILSLPVNDESFDIIFSEGVLHHTDNTEEAIKQLSSKLKKGGRFLFYVYKKKCPIREFSDDYIRNAIKDLSNEEAWHALMPLTKLGIELGKLNIELNINDDLPLLGIKKGRYNLQRFFYYNFLKTFYKNDLNLEEMNHINFDWFRPLNCHRHSPEEIQEWCEEAGLNLERLYVDESGITVVAVK